MSTEPITEQPISATVPVQLSPRETPWSVRRRARRTLRPGEVSLLTRYRQELSGRILEVGSRGDGLTDMLCFHACAFTGLSLSPLEISLCRARYPQGTFLEGGLTDLALLEEGDFDAIIVGPFALDRVSAPDREYALTQLSRLLLDDGVLIFSTRNLAGDSTIEEHDFTVLESVNRFDEPVLAGPLFDSELYLVARPGAAQPFGWSLIDGEMV